MARRPVTRSPLCRPFRVALYARTSTSRDQHPATQLHALRELASQRGWHVVGEFVDHGYSGAKDRRPQLDALMQLVHRGGANAVAVYKFDRFARSTRHLILAFDDFQSRGVEFISLSDGIDTSTPTGRFTFTLIGAVAELEKSILRSRTLSGLDAARARGARLGRPAPSRVIRCRRVQVASSPSNEVLSSYDALGSASWQQEPWKGALIRGRSYVIFGSPAH